MRKRGLGRRQGGGERFSVMDALRCTAFGFASVSSPCPALVFLATAVHRTLDSTDRPITRTTLNGIQIKRSDRIYVCQFVYNRCYTHQDLNANRCIDEFLRKTEKKKKINNKKHDPDVKVFTLFYDITYD